MEITWAQKINVLPGIGRKIRLNVNPWVLSASVIVFAISVPIFFVLLHIFEPPNEAWHHIVSTVLQRYVINTFLLILGTGVLTIIIGVSTAWLVTAYKFPGHNFFTWGLILPLSFPTYIAAFTYAGIFDFTGPVQRILRSLGDGQLAFNLDIMNLPCLILILSFVLYPYVFLIARASFLLQSQSLLETSRILGKSQTQTFFRVTLPLARPAIIGGVMLVIMEVINDYGAVKYFGVDTFTTGIFRAWFSMGDTDAAIRLCGFLMFVALCLITLERVQRGRAKFDNSAKTSRTLNKTALPKKKAMAAFLICLTPVLFGFLIPASQLLFWASQTAENVLSADFFSLIANSFFLAVLASFLCVFVAVVIVYSVRLRQSFYTQAISKISILGYSIPGAVIAVGVMIPFAWIDNGIDAFFRDHFGSSTGLILSGTLVAVTFAYVVRFLALAFNPIKSGFERLCGNVDEASRSLGHSPLKSLLKVNIPIIKGALLAAAILVFVDVLKELPLTLILRPFNFDTLATKAFELASDEMIAESANPALIIVATGIVPIILMNRLLGKISNERTNGSKSFEEVLPC